MFTETHTQFEIGERIWWKVGLNDGIVVFGLFIKDNGDGTSEVNIYQRGHQRCPIGKQNIENSILTSVDKVTPDSYQSIL